MGYFRLGRNGRGYDFQAMHSAIVASGRTRAARVTIGLDSVDQLFSGIPERLRLKRLLNIPKALTEPELIEYFRERAAKDATGAAPFIGAGIYHHYLPIVIDGVVDNEAINAVFILNPKQY